MVTSRKLNKLKVARPRLLAAAVGFVAGVAWLVTVRALFSYPEPLHYHANFAVFVNGQREPFGDFGYYEEVECSVDYLKSPQSRVHMHQPANDVVHVHGTAATWGYFFENLGSVLGDDVVRTSQGTFVNGRGGRLSLILNGERVNSITGRVINSEDRLLVSFGDPSDAAAEFEQVASTAPEYNTQPDPAACKGQVSPALGERLRHALFE